MITNLVGETIGGYRLATQIGSGALATVYKAYQPDLKRWVAIKVLQYRDKNALLRFQREAQAIANLRHRNILIVYNYGEENEWPYIVMEYIEGGTLADRLTGKPMDWVRAIDLTIPITEALGYAHEQGIIHRDVKPSNILMAQEDWPLLADFGLIKLKDAKHKGLTGPGASMGTPFYVAPEQARGQTIDHRADIYSLGVILYEMITGRLPFDYQNPNKVLLAHISEPVPPPRQFNPDCPPILEKIILTAMQKSPDQRYKNMQAMKDALKEALHSSDARLSFNIPPSRKPIPTRELDPAVPLPVSENADTSPVTVPTPLHTRLYLLEKKVSIPIPDKDNVIIGRTHKNVVADIDLGPYGAADAGVSRQHARLIKRNDDWLIDDLDSLNGTFVNNTQITSGDSPILLQDGDEVRLSRLTCLFLTS